MKNKLFGRERICASFIDSNLSGKILNIGAGEVQWIENDLFLNNPNLFSSDIDEKNLDEKNKAKNKIIIDAEKINLKDNSFSQVIILDVLEHLKNDIQAVKEINRILKKNGKIVVCVPNDTLLSYLNPVRYVQHERHYSIERITNLLIDNGFGIERVFSGGGIFELMNLYTHFLIKYTTGKIINPKFFDKLRDYEYKKHKRRGNEIAVLAKKISEN